MDSTALTEWIRGLEQQGELWKFYKSSEWMNLKDEVLREQHYECQVCLNKGKLTRADTVHHINHVKDRPDLALSKYFIDEHNIKHCNLIAICKQCHNKEHNRFTGKELLNEERW